jgi:hypothetical protein
MIDIDTKACDNYVIILYDGSKNEKNTINTIKETVIKRDIDV